MLIRLQHVDVCKNGADRRTLRDSFALSKIPANRDSSFANFGNRDRGNILPIVERFSSAFCVFIPFQLQQLCQFDKRKTRDIFEYRIIVVGQASVDESIGQKTAQLRFQIGMIQRVKKIRKIADHDIACIKLLYKIKSFFRKINITFAKIGSICDSDGIDTVRCRATIVRPVEQKSVVTIDPSVQMRSIVDLAFLCERFLPVFHFASCHGAMNKRIKSMFRNQLRRSNGIKTMFNAHAAIKMRILRVLSIVFLLLFDLLLFPFFCAHEIYLKKGQYPSARR